MQTARVEHRIAVKNMKTPAQKVFAHCTAESVEQLTPPSMKTSAKIIMKKTG